MARKSAKRRTPRRVVSAQGGARTWFFETPLGQRTCLIALSGGAGITVAAQLHSFWIPLPWLALMALWGYHFASARVEQSTLPAPAGSLFIPLAIVVAVAALVRGFKIAELPLGPSADEIFTLNNSIDLLRQPFDLFGQTPLIVEGWVETANLYLYFNTLLVKGFGANYWSMKLFSVLPGILACGALYLAARLLFDPGVALWTALLFACAHWPVRLSRYGWDASFMVMAFAMAVALLLRALQRGRPVYAYLAGIAAGLCLYSYLAARICVLSLLAFLLIEWLFERGRTMAQHGIAFVTGLTWVALPLICYSLANPRIFWVRSAELSVFNAADPWPVLVNNLWRHALMFFTFGGTYARDNYPGLAMLDPVTGVLLILGIAVMVRQQNRAEIRLLALTFGLNFLPGIFSVSQEGAPYVYRTAAVMVPAFMITGLGLQWLKSRAQVRLSAKPLTLGAWAVVLLAGALNLYSYFALEARNGAAMRVMAYEPRLLGLEIARDDLPVYLIGRELLEPSAQARPDERYAAANPPMLLPPAVRKLAVITFSGRYELSRTLSDNYERPRNIHFIDHAVTRSALPPAAQTAKLILRSDHPIIQEILRTGAPQPAVREIRNIHGEPLFSVLTPAASVPPTP